MRICKPTKLLRYIHEGLRQQPAPSWVERRSHLVTSSRAGSIDHERLRQAEQEQQLDNRMWPATIQAEAFRTYETVTTEVTEIRIRLALLLQEHRFAPILLPIDFQCNAFRSADKIIFDDTGCTAFNPTDHREWINRKFRAGENSYPDQEFQLLTAEGINALVGQLTCEIALELYRQTALARLSTSIKTHNPSAAQVIKPAEQFTTLIKWHQEQTRGTAQSRQPGRRRALSKLYCFFGATPADIDDFINGYPQPAATESASAATESASAAPEPN